MQKITIFLLLLLVSITLVACDKTKEPTITLEFPEENGRTLEKEFYPPDIKSPEEYVYSQPSDSYLARIEQEARQLYIDFFSNDFEIVEYKTIHEYSGKLWGHSAQGEVRLTKQVYINQIEGFDYPVLVLSGFTFEEDGVTVNETGGLNAYLIKDGEVTSDLDRAEFDAIFRIAPESEGGGWSARYENETLDSVTVNGESLFFLGFSNGAKLDSDMDVVLDWLRES